MSTVQIKCTDNDKVVAADVLTRSEKSIRVALPGTSIVLNLSRTDVRKPFVGSRGGMEFTTRG